MLALSACQCGAQLQQCKTQDTGKNTGSGVQWVTWDIVPDGEDAEIEVYMAGGGCTLPGRSKVLMPSEGYEGVVKFVFENISTLAVNACPPVLVGVGIATSVETAAVLSRFPRFIPTAKPSATDSPSLPALAYSIHCFAAERIEFKV